MKSSLILVVFLLLIACGGADEDSTIDVTQQTGSALLVDSVTAEWVKYLQSSDEGLWEGSTEHLIICSSAGKLTDYEALDPIVYKPYQLCTSGDTVFVTDAATQEIVALNSTGELLWKAGGEGEAPGHFPRVSTLTVSARYVAASNYYLGRIEFFNRDGSFSHSITFAGAEDIAAIDDTTFAVASHREPGGSIHILDSEEGIVRSFGEAEMIHLNDVPRMDLMLLCVSNDNRIVVFNRYEGLLAIYDLITEECIYRGSRTYPAITPEPLSITAANGQTQRLFFTVGANPFLGPEGMLNIVITGYQNDGSFFSDPENADFAPITAIDRYDWDGNYLDSYCLPDSSLGTTDLLPGNQLVVKNYSVGELILYDLQD
ncbi:MAG: hypothetical protein J7K88_01170 [Candidatus Fermentibacteraceae bacterium]|nr:hypothetical protein [Candidatus Fermentibacteraceae bacterium]